MKISSEDPILTAYALDELDEASRASVEAAFERDEALAQEGTAICALASLMSQTLQPERYSLGDERRDEILKAGQRPDADVLVMENRRRSRRQSLLAVLGVAAVVVLGFVGLSRLGTDGSLVTEPSTGEAAGGSSSPSGDALELGSMDAMPSELREEGGQTIVLRYQTMTADPSFVEKTLTEKGQLPGRARFKITEWVNAGALISEPLLTVKNIGAYAEFGPCPWDEHKALLLVNLRSLNGKGASLKASIKLNPERVKSSRLVGAEEAVSSTAATADVAPESGMMVSDQTFLYEVQLQSAAGSVGSLTLDFENETAGYLPLPASPRELAERSDDFMMACSLAQFAQWGASAKRDLAELEVTAASARQLLANGAVMGEKSRYALDMILLSEEFLRK